MPSDPPSRRTRASDLNILSTAANQLFESTSTMSAEAVLDLVAGLREASRRALSSVVPPPGGGLPKLYAVGRLVEVLVLNSHRLPPLWEVSSGRCRGLGLGQTVGFQSTDLKPTTKP